MSCDAPVSHLCPFGSLPQDISISVLLLLQELTDSDVLSEREEASVIVDAIVDKQVFLTVPFQNKNAVLPALCFYPI